MPSPNVHPAVDLTLWAHGPQMVEVSSMRVKDGMHILTVGTWPVTLTLFLDHATALSIQAALAAATQDAERRGMIPGVPAETDDTAGLAFSWERLCKDNDTAEECQYRYLCGAHGCIFGMAPQAEAPEQLPDGMRRCAVCQDIVAAEECSPKGICPECTIRQFDEGRRER